MNSNSSSLLDHIIANSLFTPRQISIISNRLQDGRRPQDISSGAYYRQLKQCRRKVTDVLYSTVLLQSTGVLEPDALLALSRLAEQLAVMFSSDRGDISSSQLRMDDVITVMEQLVKRISKL